ncbi:hypothetical protein FHL43_03955 [Salmonella enterica]|nr:hypothetical protein [Salmonella enterica]EBE4411934.1 hypothetical protein [Salmonella enterica]EGI3250838.1 hypothetical protein [Salmonella enterica]EGQ1148323.1 hypothetical protein [Salmonella enterica]EMD6909700.1 hypothetical protein [Citrobacter freundii]
MYLMPGDELEIGDIILTSENTAVSKTVRFATQSEFSHAMLYVGDHSYIHSDANGVHSGNLQRLLFPSKENVAIVRVNCNRSEKEKACDFARSKIGTSYSVKEAVNAKLKIPKKAKENRQYCSRLVVQSYDFADVSLVKNINYCTPQDIIESEKVSYTTIVARMATKQEIKFANERNPIQRQTEITNSILQSVRCITGKDIQTLEQVIEYVILFPNNDESISKVFKDSGYLDMWKYEVEKNSWRYDAIGFLKLNIPPSQLIDLASRELQMGRNRLVRYQANYMQYLHLNKIHGGECLGEHVKLYENLVRNTKDNIKAASCVLAILSEKQMQE